MRAKKSLGQNFLRDKGILKKIAAFARIQKGDTIVEVGPGEGTLTRILLEQAEKVIAVEKDEALGETLKQNFHKEISEDRLQIITGDALELPDGFFGGFAHFSSKNMPKKPSGSSRKYKLVGNIPYYITGALFKKALESATPPESITFVVQKEVADRIMARDGKESILSISVKAYGEPEYGGIIKAGSFYPKPKVDSAIISIKNINKNKFSNQDISIDAFERIFFEILKQGFSHKRKLLIRNLENLQKIEKLKKIFERLRIPEKTRAEDLKIEDWLALAKDFSPKER